MVLKIAFWEDDRLGRGSLKTLYPDIYSINQQQEATVGVWTLTFKRRLFDWEIGGLSLETKNVQSLGVEEYILDEL